MVYKTTSHRLGRERHYWLVRPSMQEIKGFWRAEARRNNGPMNLLLVEIVVVATAFVIVPVVLPLWRLLLACVAAAALAALLYLNYRHYSHYRRLEREHRVVCLDEGIGRVLCEEVLFAGSPRLIAPYCWKLFEEGHMPTRLLNNCLRDDVTRDLLAQLARTAKDSKQARGILLAQIEPRVSELKRALQPHLRHYVRQMESDRQRERDIRQRVCEGVAERDLASAQAVLDKLPL